MDLRAGQVRAYQNLLDAEGLASVVGGAEQVAAPLGRFAEAGVTEFGGLSVPRPRQRQAQHSTALLSEMRG